MPLDQTGQSGTYRHGPLHTQHRDRAPNALTGQLVWQIVPPSPASLPAYRFSSSAQILAQRAPNLGPEYTSICPGIGHDVLARNLG